MADNADPAGELTLLLDDDVVDIEDYGAECSADDADGAPDPPCQRTDVGRAARDAARLWRSPLHWLFWWDGWDFVPTSRSK